MKQVKRAYKYRFCPTPEQATLLSRTFGCARKVYNKALAERTRAYKDEGRRLSYNDTSALLTEWKKDPELDYLREVSSVPLQQSLMHLNRAFMNFFDKRTAYPRFHSKHAHRDSAEFTYRAFTYTPPSPDTGGQPMLRIAKTTEPLTVTWHRDPPAGATPSTLTISRDPSGRWYASLLFQAPVDTLPAPVHVTAGVDMGQGDTVAVNALNADGTTHTYKTPGLMPRTGLENKLAKAQKVMAHKMKGSKNNTKAARKVARIHATIADQRRDQLHKTALRLVRDNQAIGIEDLSVRDMTASNRGTITNPGHNVQRRSNQNRRNLDVGYRMLRTMIEYKADWHDRTVVPVDRYYPSSKICSTTGCDYLSPAMPTRIRTWTCPRCGTTHDRDINAAINIRAAATAVLACGEGVRLRRGKHPDTAEPFSETGNLDERSSKPGPEGPGS